MDSNLLDYIILALAFAVVIHIFVQTFRKCGNKTEKMNAPMSSIYNDERPYSYGNATANLFDNSSVESRQESYQPLASKCPQIFPNSPGSQENYIQKFVMGAGRVCSDENNSEIENIQNYQNNFFGFGEQINKSTREGITEVDRINEMQTAQNNELNICSGQKISDIYDNLVKSNCDQIKKCKNEGCVIPSMIDEITQTTTYSKQNANGNSFTRYNVMFETDGVNNGGKFYDDIEGFDSMSENNLIV